jgi:hypothetical protein
VPCFGKADNRGAADHKNSTRDPTLPYGDHPLGMYRITGWAPSSRAEFATFGPAGKLVLDPYEGQALIAKANGRYGLLLHGGALGGPYPRGFRPTYGCLRLLDPDVLELVAWWRETRCAWYRAERALRKAA